MMHGHEKSDSAIVAVKLAKRSGTARRGAIDFLFIAFGFFLNRCKEAENRTTRLLPTQILLDILTL